jgi:hypothetical protein
MCHIKHKRTQKLKKLIINYLSWNKLMPLVILVMKELFLAVGFKFQAYVPRG